MDTADKAKLAAVAPKITAAQPKTPSAVLTFVKAIVLPILPSVVSALLVRASAKTKAILREARDVLVNADLGD